MRKVFGELYQYIQKTKGPIKKGRIKKPAKRTTSLTGQTIMKNYCVFSVLIIIC